MIDIDGVGIGLEIFAASVVGMVVLTFVLGHTRAIGGRAWFWVVVAMFVIAFALVGPAVFAAWPVALYCLALYLCYALIMNADDLLSRGMSKLFQRNDKPSQQERPVIVAEALPPQWTAIQGPFTLVDGATRQEYAVYPVMNDQRR